MLDQKKSQSGAAPGNGKSEGRSKKKKGLEGMSYEEQQAMLTMANPNAKGPHDQPLTMANPNAQHHGPHDQPLTMANPNAQHHGPHDQPLTMANPNAHGPHDQPLTMANPNAKQKKRKS
jgi:hypothetical protein